MVDGRKIAAGIAFRKLPYHVEIVLLEVNTLMSFDLVLLAHGVGAQLLGIVGNPVPAAREPEDTTLECPLVSLLEDVQWMDAEESSHGAQLEERHFGTVAEELGAAAAKKNVSVARTELPGKAM